MAPYSMPFRTQLYINSSFTLNLKTGVVKHPKEGDIILTDAYEALGLHYVTAIMPAGVRKPMQQRSLQNCVTEHFTISHRWKQLSEEH